MVEEDLIYAHGGRLYIPTEGYLYNFLLQNMHDQWARHPRVKKMALPECSYYWPKMKDDAQLYVKTCLMCQTRQDKEEETGKTSTTITKS